MDALQWLMLFVLIASACIVFSNVSWVRPNHRRLFIGLLGLLAIVVYVRDLLTGVEFSVPRLVGIVFSGLGGGILVLVAFWPKIQNGKLEYLGWALTVGSWGGLVFGKLLFSNSEWLQFGTGLLGILVNYASQWYDGKPFGVRE